MIAHADVQKPKIQACVVVHMKPCSATIRTLLKNGQYRYHRVILRGPSGAVGFVLDAVG